MIFKIAVCVVLMFSLFTSCSSNSQQTINDTSQNIQNDIVVNDENIKISVASVAISQILAEMNQEIVGRPTTKLALPERYLEIEEIGSSFSPDFEKVLAVGTELLIGDSLFKEKIDATAKQYGIDTFYIDTSTYESFLFGIDELGRKIGKEEEATSIIARFQEPLNNLKDINKDLKVAIIFGTSESNMLATEDTYVGSLIKALGLKNVVTEITGSASLGSEVHETNSSYVNLNLEQLLQNQPDVILRFGHGNIEEANRAFEKLFNENPAWKNLEAVKNGKIYDLDPNIFGSSANNHVDEALMQLGEIFNGL